MMLSIRQKSNIRHFAYHLTNGTLDFELIQEAFGGSYYDILKTRPDLFYKTSCVYINQEITLNLDWPDTEKLAKFLCQLFTDNVDKKYFKEWETDFTTDKLDFSSDFKRFVSWFITAKTVQGVTYKEYIDSGASFVEQCFAIWANVVTLNSKILNYDYAIERVEQYIKSYYIQTYISNLEEWECELHME